MRSSCLQFSTLVITGRRTDSAHSISVNRHSFYIQLSTSYPFIRLSGFTDTQHQCISLYFIRIKATDGISVTNRYQVNKIYQSIYLIQGNSTQDSTAERFPRRTITARVFPTFLISLPSSMNRNHILNGIRSVHFTIAYSELVYLFPQRFAISSVLYRSTDGYTGKLRTGFLYFFRYFYFHIYFYTAFFQ